MKIIDTDFLQIICKYLRNDISPQNMDTEIRLGALGLDSMTAIHLIFDIEEKYGIMFPDEYLTNEAFESATKLWEITESLTRDSAS